MDTEELSCNDGEKTGMETKKGKVNVASREGEVCFEEIRLT